MNSEKIHIVILGSTGFVGSAIIRRLKIKYADSVSIKALVRNDTIVQEPCIEYIRGSLPDDIPENFFPDEPHVILHFATKQINDGTGFKLTNEIGTERLLDMIPKSTMGIIYGSSLSVYGCGSQEKISENAPVNPGTELAVSRSNTEKLIMEKMSKNNRSAFILRPRFIYGHGDRYTLPNYIEMINNNRYYGTGNQAFSFIDVDDYADIIIELSFAIRDRYKNKNPLCSAFNVGYAEAIRFIDIIHILCKIYGLKQPDRRINIWKWLLNLMCIIPIKSIQNIGIGLELISLTHTCDVSKLESEIGPDITGQNPTQKFEDIVLRYYENKKKISKNYFHT